MKTYSRGYLIGVLVFSFFIIFSYVFQLSQSKLVTRQVTLKTNPVYDYSVNKGVRYWVALSFYEMDGKFEISGANYQYLDHPEFLREIKKDTVVTVIYSDRNIVQLSKYGYTFIDSVTSKYHMRQNVLFANVLFTSGLCTCLLIFLLRKVMNVRLFLLISKYFLGVLFCVLFITYLIASYYIDDRFISSSWTQWPLEKRKSN